jgi:butyryl-CoA dehydrogenase
MLKNVKLLAQSSGCTSRSFTTKLSDELKSLQELCKKFANEELKPVAAQLDKECKFPKTQVQKLGDLGLMGIGAASEFGGANMSTLALSIAVEELSQGCSSTGAIVSIHNCLYANLLNRLGNQEQKIKFLKPFTDGKKIGAFALSESGLSGKFIGFLLI